MAIPFHLALYRTFHAQKNTLRPFMSSLRLSPGQPKILYYLNQQGDCIQRDLAENCDIEPATVSRILDNMEQTGLIRRTASPDNRRSVFISITPQGEAACQSWEDVCDRIELASLNGFSENEKKQFSDYLHRMYQNLTGRKLE